MKRNSQSEIIANFELVTFCNSERVNYSSASLFIHQQVLGKLWCITSAHSEQDYYSSAILNRKSANFKLVTFCNFTATPDLTCRRHRRILSPTSPCLPRGYQVFRHVGCVDHGGSRWQTSISGRYYRLHMYASLSIVNCYAFIPNTR